jgi:hypothetical protein
MRSGCSNRPRETQPTFPSVAFSSRPPRPLREAFFCVLRARLLHPHVAGLDLGEDVADKDIGFYAEG